MFTAQDLRVVAVYNNPRRWKSRERLLRAFIQHMLDSGVSLTLVEHAFGERDHAFDKGDPFLRHVNHVQVRGGANQELWIKEALQKVGVRTLPPDWRYLAVIDADVAFQRSDWAMETIHMLQHHRVGQTHSHSIDLDMHGRPLINEWGVVIDRSFCQAWMDGDVAVVRDDYGVGQPLSMALLEREEKSLITSGSHYGFSWAMRREAWDGIGGLPDWLVTGSADYHSALAFAGIRQTSDAYLSPSCARRLGEFSDRCDEHVRQDIGVVPGILHHGFHGTKKKRSYMTRKYILAESQFDPDRHLTYDWQGIPSLAGDNRILRDGLRRLNVSRDEDSSE